MENRKTKDYFETVYEQTQHKVKLYLLSRCKDMFDVNDLFQETYIEFYDVLQKKGTGYVKNPEALAIQIAKRKLNKFYGFLYKISNQISVDDELFQERELKEREDLDIEEQTIRREFMEDITKKLMEKSGDIQKIFYLYYGMDYTLAEIAAVLGLKQSTVKTKLYRTLKEFQLIYQEERQNEGA